MAIVLAVGVVQPAPTAAASASFGEGFDDVGETQPGDDGPQRLVADGWTFRNQSEPEGTRSWFGLESGAHEGTGYLAVDYGSTECGAEAAISNWAVLPPIPDQAAGDVMSFFVKGGSGARVDRVQVRYSPSGATDTGSGADDVGDFTEVLLDWQSEPFTPASWEQQSFSLPGSGRIAFRYYLPDADACNSAAYLLGLDALTIGTPPPGPVPLPQPGETVTWDSSHSPVTIEGRVIIPADGTVLVEPGVEIRVTRDSTLVVNGTLRGAGTAESPITVTAAAVFPPAVEVRGQVDLDRTLVGGQVRLESGGSAVFAASTFREFGTIRDDGLAYLEVDGSRFEKVDLVTSDTAAVVRDSTFLGASAIFFGGRPYLHSLSFDGGSLSVGAGIQGYYVNDVTVRNASGAGLNVGDGNAFIGPNVTLENNEYPVSVGDAGGLLPGSHVPATGNRNNLVRGPSGFGDIGGSPIWSNVGIPYVIDDHPTLLGMWRLLPGTTVKMGPGAGFEAENNGLIARGRPGEPVTFERADPDQPWGGILTPGRLDHVVVSGSKDGVVQASLGTPGFIDSSVLRDNERGIKGPFIVRGSQFLDNTTGAVTGFPGDLNGETNPNSFSGNDLAVEDASDATHNWWGDPSGPTVDSNPRGTGDPITGLVPYEPFRTEPPDVADSPPVVELLPPSFLAEPGETVVLRWDASDDVTIASQRILFSREGDSPDDYTVIADGLPADQRSFTWTVPDVGFQTSGLSASIRVETVDDAGQVGWDATAPLVPAGEIQDAQVVLTSGPSGSYTAGDEAEACYRIDGYDPAVSGVSAYLFLDGDREEISLGGRVGTEGCFPLTMPFVSTDTARVGLKLYGSNNRQQFMFGDYFSIRLDPRVPDAAPSVNLETPASGETFRAGETIPMSWTASDDVALRSFAVHGSYDGGRTWHVVADSLPANARSFAWETPSDAKIADVRVRVVAHDLRFRSSSGTAQVSIGGESEPPPSADTVEVTAAEYRTSKQELRVDATTTSPDAVLTVHVTDSGEEIGTLERKGNGSYRGRFNWPTNPQSITVRSSDGGSDEASVTTRR